MVFILMKIHKYATVFCNIMKRGQFSVLGFVMFLLFLVFMGILSALFLIPLVSVTVNLAIIYFLFLRARADFLKYKRTELYIVAGVASILVLLIVGNLLPLWIFTTWFILTVIFVHVYLLLSKKKW